MDRISREQYLIASVKLVAQRGTCLRAKVGCIIEIDGRIVATGYNGSLPGESHCTDPGVGCLIIDGHCKRTIHAEANALCWAARRGSAVEGARMWTYGWKGGICPECRKLARAAGVVDIVEIPLEETEEEATRFGRLHP